MDKELPVPLYNAVFSVVGLLFGLREGSSSRAVPRPSLSINPFNSHYFIPPALAPNPIITIFREFLWKRQEVHF